MAVIEKPINRITVIKADESRKFVKDFNSNVVTKEFLDRCEKISAFFGVKKSNEQ